ncbi:hypothetical protein ACH5RR_013814 [Cinchona calisaya]|uniref:Major facilitator superfamily (MFS) profile domain-containing protein n=1 Tax=Cinchona calisaya TaxID=153742 RepID=A0ABD3A3R2_9GENT
MGGGSVAAVGGGGGDGKDYPGKVTKYVTFTALSAAAGGLIFGYDIGISGGVTSMAGFLKPFFPAVYRKEELHHSANQYCKFDSQILTLFTSSLYLAATFASFVGSKLSNKYGRKVLMTWGGLIFLVGAIFNAAAVHISMLILGRILLGTVPLYLSEMSPHKSRGKFNVLFQLSITLGIFAANLVNYGTGFIHGGWGWRISLGGAAVPAIMMMALSWFLFDTPTSLLERGKKDEAKAQLQRVRGVANVDLEFNDIMNASEASKSVGNPWSNLLKRQYRPQFIMSFMIPFLQQFTGINVVMFYAPVLFKTLGFGSSASLASAVITGLVNVGATFISVFGTDIWGRRPLFFVGGGIMFVFQGVLAALIGSQFGYSGQAIDLSKGIAVLIVMCICAFVAAFAFSWGPLGWLVPSEIFPLEIRSAAQCVTVGTNMIFTFLIAQVFLKMLCSMKFYLFVFFAVFELVMTVFVFALLPETKNIPIEEMTKIWRDHWYWKRFVVDKDDGKYSRGEGDLEMNLGELKALDH